MNVGISISYRIFFAAALVLQIFTLSAVGQEKVKVEIRVDGATKVLVKGSAGTRRTLSFAKNDLGFSGLAERVSEISLTSAKGEAVAFKEPIRGEVVADSDFVNFSYLIDLSPRREQAAAAHLSWMASDSGLLMLGDMLPIFSIEGKPVAASVKLDLLNGLRQKDNRVDDTFETLNLAETVVALLKNTDFRMVWVDKVSINIANNNDRWHFTGDELVNFSSQVYKSSRDVFGGDAQTEVFVNVFRFPFDPKMNPGSWQAETRGNNITIISSDMAFRTQSVQRLHEQLRHEMFHLWVPNGVALTGKYDWFYEGFALYQSLRIGLAENRISFGDYLDTLSRAKAIEARQTKKGSLIEASKQRWQGAETYIYAKGLLVAFLCDVAMLDASKGKRSVESVLRELYQRHSKANGKAAQDANTAILALLNENRELKPIIERYITGGDELDLMPFIGKAGIEFAGALKVVEKPSSGQRRILDALYYNNWRNIRR